MIWQTEIGYRVVGDELLKSKGDLGSISVVIAVVLTRWCYRAFFLDFLIPMQPVTVTQRLFHSHYREQ